MTAEETIQQQLAGKFPFLAEKIKIQRARRMWAETPAENFDEVFKYLVEELHFPMLCAITGLDEGVTFGLLYHLAQENGIMLHLKVSIPREKPIWKSIINFFPGNELCEREVADLFGITFEGLPPGMRYPLHDNWPADEYPLRKDWQAKHEVAVASEVPS